MFSRSPSPRYAIAVTTYRRLSIIFCGIASAELGVAARSVSPEAMALLATYDWPGNIRELVNVTERAVLLCDGPELLSTHLPSEIITGESKAVPSEKGLWAAERSMIVKALHENNWNQSKAARTLGISRDNLRYRVKKYDITREEDAKGS